MAYISGASISTFKDTPQLNLVTSVVVLPATTSSGDIYTFDYHAAGMTKIWDVKGTCHTTANSVMIPENPVTVLSGSDLQLTVGSSLAGGAKIRVYRITGTS